MGRMIKCKDRKELVDSDLAFRTKRLTSSGKTVSEVWSSKEGYESYRKNVEYKTKCHDLMKELLGYQGAKTCLPTTWHTGIEEFRAYGFEVVYDYIEENKNIFIKVASEWGNKPETNLMRYCLGIIRNNIKQYSNLKQNIAKAKALQERQSSQYTDDDLGEINRLKTTKDITKWVEEA